MRRSADIKSNNICILLWTQLQFKIYLHSVWNIIMKIQEIIFTDVIVFVAYFSVSKKCLSNDFEKGCLWEEYFHYFCREYKLDNSYVESKYRRNTIIISVLFASVYMFRVRLYFTHQYKWITATRYICVVTKFKHTVLEWFFVT